MGCGNSKGKGAAKGAAPVVEKTVELFGIGKSMNTVGAAMLVETHACGVLVPTVPGEATEEKTFLSMNPFHAIPTIKDKGKDVGDDFCLAESSTILRYLAQKYAPALYPRDDPKRCGFIDWAMDRCGSSLMGDVYATIYPVLGFMPAPADQAAAGKQAGENLTQFADFFLKEKFIGGSGLSIADYKVAPFFFAWEHPKVKSQSQVDIPERIKQFNFDFEKACAGATLLAVGDGSLKDTLDGGSISDALSGGTEVTVETKDLLQEKKQGGKGKVEIYGVPASMNCMGPIQFAMELEIGQMTECMPGEGTQTAEFLAMNPFHGVPTLKDGDYSLGESNAVLRYMAQAYAPKYYPEVPRVRGIIDWAMDRFSTVMYADAAKTLYVCFGYASAPEKEEDLFEAAKDAIKNLEEFADHFMKEKFIGGEMLSIADFKVAPFFFAYGHSYVQERCRLELPKRIQKFNEDFAAECKSATMLKDAGGYSLQEWLDKKATNQPQTEKEAAMEEGMEDQVEDLAAVADAAEVTETPKDTGSCGCGMF